ncbi:MAG: hypothetical protein ACOYT9_02400 [Patescibacteria group bacterium]
MRLQHLPDEILNEHAQFLIRCAFWSQVHALDDIIKNGDISELSREALECHYHFAAMFTDLMSIKSGELVLREIRLRQGNRVASHLFVRGLTGDYRDRKYLDTTMLPPDITVYREIFQLVAMPNKPNSPEDNANIVMQLKEEVGNSLFNIINEKEHQYLKDRLPKDFVRDTVERDIRTMS